MNRLLLALCLMVCSSLVACGGSSSGHLPVDSPLTPFQPPHAEDLVESEEDDDGELDDYDDLDDLDDTGELDDWGETETDDDSADEPDTPKPGASSKKAKPARVK